jgi:hypothetical protein
MKFSSLQKLGGIAIISGSVLFALWAICWTTMLPVESRYKDFSVMILSPNWLWISSVSLFGLVLMIFGFSAIYARLHKDAGISGFIGYVLIMIAYILQAAEVTWEVFVYPAIVSYAPAVDLFKNRLLWDHPLIVLYRNVLHITIFLGVVLFCKMLIKAKEFPKMAGILFLVGAVTYAVCASFNMYLEILGVLILSAGCFILGRTMFSQSPK